MKSQPIDRRNFLASSAAAVTLLAGNRMAWAADKAPDASRLIAGKDPRLIVHSADPLEIETPLKLLREHKITPKNLLFVRNNQMLADAATLEPINDPAWTVELTGLLGKPASISVGELKKIDQVKREVVLQCSGNGRRFFMKGTTPYRDWAGSKATGAPWEHGAMGNVVFKGVPLAAVIDRLKLKVSPDARFLTAEGKDAPTKTKDADFEHSIPLADALDRSLLALELNGEPIPAVHGGPLRLVTPGYYATMNVKWLSRLRFEARETDNHHQVHRYRTPREIIKAGEPFEYGKDNSDANWRMRPKSVIFSPLDGEKVPGGGMGGVEVRAVAWGDGVVPLARVELSTDAGMTWRTALSAGRGEAPFAWTEFSWSFRLPPGRYHLAARVIDALGRTQPPDGRVHWNPAGYAWNGVHMVTVQVAGG